MNILYLRREYNICRLGFKEKVDDKENDKANTRITIKT